jgi:O-antigen ligase
LWRLAIILLPWQTRWIFQEETIAGFHWESATVSVYVTWIVLLLTAILSTVLFWDRWKEKIKLLTASDPEPIKGLFQWIAFVRNGFKAPTWKQKIQACCRHSVTKAVIASLIAIALLLPTVFSSVQEVSFLWWGNILVLVLFFFSLWIADLKKETLIFWFVLSVLPHAVIGLVQYYSQDAIGSTILGMAVHHPWIAGTSVVEHGLYRVLRAYGGFPHPNILGGWLAVVITMLPFLVPVQKNSFGRIFVLLAGVFLSAGLVFSFSRSAWIAAIIGLIASCCWLWRSLDEVDRLRLISCFIIVIASIGVCVVMSWDDVNARFHPEENRLEMWSLVSRSRASKEGMEAFADRQITGWGQGSSLLASVISRTPQLKEHPSLLLVEPEPAHNIPQVILVEMGLFGFLAIIALLIALYRACSIHWKFRLLDRAWTIWIPHPLLIVLATLACFDHYLWTTWAGQSLLMVTLLMSAKDSYL